MDSEVIVDYFNYSRTVKRFNDKIERDIKHYILCDLIIL